MDDLSEKLSSLLNDPDSIEALKGMARSLMSSQGSEKQEDNSGMAINPSDMQKIMKVMGVLRSNSVDDSRTRLLMSLKPYVRTERQGRIEEAVKMLRLVSVLPMLTSSGLI